MLTFRFLELVAPTEDAGLGAVMLGLGLIAPLHPDAGHRGVDVDVLRAQREGLLAGGEGFVGAGGGPGGLGEVAVVAEILQDRVGDGRQVADGLAGAGGRAVDDALRGEGGIETLQLLGALRRAEAVELRELEGPGRLRFREQRRAERRDLHRVVHELVGDATGGRGSDGGGEAALGGGTLAAAGEAQGAASTPASTPSTR